MHRAARVLPLLLLILSLAAGAQPQAPDLDADAAALIARVLASTCLADDAPQLRATLRARGPDLAPLLRAALDAGPPPAVLAAVRDAAATRARARRDFKWDGIVVTGVSRDAMARFARQTEREMIDEEMRRYVLGWRANALAALGVIGDAVDVPRLRRLAADPRDPLAPAARAALAAPR